MGTVDFLTYEFLNIAVMLVGALLVAEIVVRFVWNLRDREEYWGLRLFVTAWLLMFPVQDLTRVGSIWGRDVANENWLLLAEKAFAVALLVGVRYWLGRIDRDGGVG